MRRTLPALALAAAALVSSACSGGHAGPPAEAGPSTSSPASTSPSTALVLVPGLIGATYYPLTGFGTATADLVVALSLAHSDTAPTSAVVAQSPGAGSLVPKGSTLSVVLSIGPASLPGAGPCRAADLRVQPGPPVAAATGRHTAEWSLTNTGGACYLSGYGVVSAFDPGGRVLPYTYSDAGAAPAPVFLLGGSAAWVGIDKYRCDIQSDDTTADFALQLPSSGGAANLPLPSGTSIDFCSQPQSRVITVSPFEPVELLLSGRTAPPIVPAPTGRTSTSPV